MSDIDDVQMQTLKEIWISQRVKCWFLKAVGYPEDLVDDIRILIAESQVWAEEGDYDRACDLTGIAFNRLSEASKRLQDLLDEIEGK